MRNLRIFSFFLLIITSLSQAQNITFNSGSYIFNNCYTPQAVGEEEESYRVIYDLIKNFDKPIFWIICPNKLTVGLDYRLGLVAATTDSPIEVPSVKNIIVSSAQVSTLNKQPCSKTASLFMNAGILASALYCASSSCLKTPAELHEYYALFAMPNSRSALGTKANLISGSLIHKEAIWTTNNSGGALKLMLKPANSLQHRIFFEYKNRKSIQEKRC